MDKEELRERYEATGDENFYRQAMPLYEQALATNPTDARLLRDYGYLQQCHGRYALQAAVTCYHRAIEADPQSEKAHYQLLSALAAVQDLDERVVASYEQRIANAPNDPVGYRLLAVACLLAADYDKAERAIHAGLAIAPEDPALIERQGDLYAATGRTDDALTSWRRAFVLAPSDYGISMRFSAALLLERHGQIAEATQEWRYIIEWLEERGETIHLDWPRSELRRLHAKLTDS